MSQEEDIGILEWVSKGEQIKGAFKYRYSDFLVNEIDEKGEVVFHNPQYQAEQEIEIQKEKKEQESKQLNLSELEEKVVEILGKEQTRQLYQYIHDKRSGDYGYNELRLTLLETHNNKAGRTQVHSVVNEYYQDFESSTEDNQLVIRHLGNKQKKKRFSQQEQHLQFTLYKHNLDSHSAINLLSQYLHKPFSHFGISGNKDKRGITTQ